MIRFQLDNLVTLSKYDMVDLYERYQVNSYLSKANRKLDLILSTFALLLLGLVLSASLGMFIDEIIFSSIEGTTMRVFEYIIYLNLCGLVLLGFKILYDSIVYTYLVHSILIKLEKGKSLVHIHQYLYNEWGIDLNV